MRTIKILLLTITTITFGVWWYMFGLEGPISIVLMIMVATAFSVGLYILRLEAWIKKIRYPSALRMIWLGRACVFFSLVLLISKFISFDPPEIKLSNFPPLSDSWGIFVTLIGSFLNDAFWHWRGKKNR